MSLWRVRGLPLQVDDKTRDSGLSWESSRSSIVREDRKVPPDSTGIPSTLKSTERPNRENHLNVEDPFLSPKYVNFSCNTMFPVSHPL